MAPCHLYNWLCVSHSVSDVLINAASIRARQLLQKETQARIVWGSGFDKARQDVHKRQAQNAADFTSAQAINEVNLESSLSQPLEGERGAVIYTSAVNKPSLFLTGKENEQRFERPLLLSQEFDTSISPTPGPGNAATRTLDESSPSAIEPFAARPSNFIPPTTTNARTSADPFRVPDGFVSAKPTPAMDLNPELENRPPESQPRRVLQASRVPSSRIGRFFHYGGLAASLGYGAAAEALRRTRVGSSDNENSSSLVMTPANVSRLVSKLSKMRGAALKLGQFMSIQDSNLLPKDVEEIFRKVQDSAHYMPNWQMERVMSSSLGAAWHNNFATFDSIPFAAASLGQVHCGVLAASVSPTGKDERVAVKVQFPNIAQSLESDLGYMKLLLGAGKLLPPGLFLDRTIKVMKEELKDECDYRREASFMRAFSDCIGRDTRFRVPWVWEGSTDTVLVMEHMEGVSVGGQAVEGLNQADRDEIASRVIELCMKELFVYRMMQTDPNWTNFFWNGETRQIELIDFGATREYTKDFIDKWLRLLQAAVAEDLEACVAWSHELGYLTGEENETMRDAHVRSLVLLAKPFRGDIGSKYSFGPGTDSARITAEIRSLIPVMLRYRLTPPPRETYSLNRKLSGAFLLASRLGANVDCRRIWDDVVGKYAFSS